MTVYCKHCGKQITDDSSFCKYCGGKQDIHLTSANNRTDENLNSFAWVKSLSTVLSEKRKKYLILYVIWVTLNCIFWMYGENIKHAKLKFFPFTEGNNYDYFFNLDYYDSTEFIVYVLLIPLMSYFYYQYCHEKCKLIFKAWKEKKGKNQ